MKRSWMTLFFVLLSALVLLAHQETPKDPSVFFQSIDENIPNLVKKVKKESLVAVRAGIPHWEEDKGMHHDYLYGAGFVPVGWDGYVLTCLHLAGAYPAVWVDETYPLIFQVFDGQDTFNAKMVSFNPYADLALLKVVTTDPNGKNFKAQPALIATKTVDDSGKNPLPEKFYAFSFFTDHPTAFFTLQIGPLRAVTNALNEKIFPIGILQGQGEHGFSGGPVMAPNGVFVGMIVKTSPAFSYMVLAETMHAFLAESKKLLEEDKSKEEKK